MQNIQYLGMFLKIRVILASGYLFYREEAKMDSYFSKAFSKAALLLLLVAMPGASWASDTYLNNVGEALTLVVGQEYFISTEDVQVRSTPDDSNRSNVEGKVRLNDKIEVVQGSVPGSNFIAVKIKKSKSIAPSNRVLYVSKNFISSTEIAKKRSPYFVIQNIATEMTRVYQRCDVSPNCPHKLIFETKMVVGRPEEGTENDPHGFKTMLGHSVISEWIKFYQDGKGHYPHWYRNGQRLSTIPPKAPLNSKGQPEGGLSWGNKWRTTVNGEETMYGAFGWYAAKLHPATGSQGVNAQWIHGTIGWGSDGEVAIELTRSALLNIFSNPGSAGCTRLSNASVAYLRHLLPVGTDIYRVYAREATRANPCARKSIFGSCKEENIFSAYRDQPKSKTWSYVMVTDGAQRSGGVSADYNAISQLGIVVKEGVNLIEKGVYTVDQYPNVAEADYRYEPSSGRTGDRYQLDDEFGEQATRFTGHFIVDEGRFVNYQHPNDRKIPIGGLLEFRKEVPAFLKTNGDFFPAQIYYRQKQGK